MWETWVRSLGWEDPLEEGIATHSSILAWRISWTEEPGRLQSMGSQRVGHNWATKHRRQNSVLVKVTQRNRTKTSRVCHVCYMCVSRERERNTYYKKLANAIMEADKTQDLQSATWRPRRADGIAPAQVQRPKRQESQWYDSSLKASRFGTQEDVSGWVWLWGKSKCPSSKAIRQKEFLLTHPFWSL